MIAPSQVRKRRMMMPRFNSRKRRPEAIRLDVSKRDTNAVDANGPTEEEARPLLAEQSASPVAFAAVEPAEEKTPTRVLIAGAGGAIGYPLLRLVSESGAWVRTLSKSRWRAAKISLLADELWLRDATDRETIRGICGGVDVVVSCLGGSLDPRQEEKRGFAHLDFEANRNLLAEAVESKVKRFVYVSVFSHQDAENTAYVRAHRRFEKALQESGIPHTILRFTGLHTAPDSLLAMARSGSMPLFGRSDARVNPIHPEDAAKLCLEHLEAGPELVEAGGPEIYTRRELSEMAFGAVGASPSFYRVPSPWLFLNRNLTRLINPRRANLLEFQGGAARQDLIAPRIGTRSVADYLLDCNGRLAFLTESVM
jgi:uncharacterized protein YbjT (DUF2867 family)